MATESAREAHRVGCAGSPTGFRRLTLNLLRADRAAEGFDGLPKGVRCPGSCWRRSRRRRRDSGCRRPSRTR
jgi:hypothetical protein